MPHHAVMPPLSPTPIHYPGADPGFKNIFDVGLPMYSSVFEVGGGGGAGYCKHVNRHSYRNSVILETKIFVI